MVRKRTPHSEWSLRVLARGFAAAAENSGALADRLKQKETKNIIEPDRGWTAARTDWLERPLAGRFEEDQYRADNLAPARRGQHRQDPYQKTRAKVSASNRRTMNGRKMGRQERQANIRGSQLLDRPQARRPPVRRHAG